MQFQYNNEVYDVRFLYQNPSMGKNIKNPLNETRRSRIVTICTIAKRLAKASYEPVCEGKSIKNPIDIFSKQKGRILALADALKSLQNKEFRKMVWLEYSKSHSGADKIFKQLQQQ